MSTWVLHFDGLCEPSNPGGVACFGFEAARDGVLVHEGWGLAAPPGPEATSNVGEYRAAIEALRWMLQHAEPTDQITVRGDSTLVIRQLQGNYRVNADRLKPLYEEARALLGQLPPVTLEWVPRGENKAADALSRRGYTEAVQRNPEWKDIRPSDSWKAEPATLRQMNRLRELGVVVEPGMTKGAASALLEVHLRPQRQDGA